MIITIEKLAENAYKAYRKKAIELDTEGMAGYAEQWAELDEGTQACWVAAAQQMVAEIAAMH